MRICDLETGLGRLANALSKLKERWHDVKEHWRDETARKFETTFLQPIPTRLTMLATSVQRLSETLDAANNHLDDRPAIE